MPDAAAGPAGRRLVLLRHARAESGEGTDDAGRPIALAGRRQAPGVGTRLAEAGWIPDHVLVSSAVRTRQTWELVRGGLGATGGGGTSTVRVTDLLYGADTAEIITMLREVPDDVRTLLVVGHEPTMSATAALLDGGRAAGGSETDDGRRGSARARVSVGLSTAAFAVLAVDGAWSALGPGGARLIDVVVPE